MAVGFVLFIYKIRLLPEDAGDDDDDNGNADETGRVLVFQPSEEAISQLVDMGFSREHAVDALARAPG